jgi:hypothetical protein
MKPKLLVVLWIAAPLGLGAADVQWGLQQSTLTYHVSHPLHQINGVSHAARGKGVCHSGQCDFLVAVPVKSFDSGDSDRDLHMIQVARGAQFPMVTVRFRLPEDAGSQATIHVDLDIEFAGQTALQTGCLPEDTARKRCADLLDHPGQTDGLQNRPSVAARNPYEGRDAGARRHDLAADVGAGAEPTI